jgi:hypothetical protein
MLVFLFAQEETPLNATPIMSLGLIAVAVVGLLLVVGLIVIVAAVAANSKRPDR